MAIGRRLFDSRIDAIVKNMRSGENIIYLYRDESPRTMIDLLKKGWVMGALIDQDTSVDGVFAHFMGHLAYTPSGPVRLAMKYDLPVFVATTARQSDNTHYVNMSGRIEMEKSGNAKADLVRNVEKVNTIIGDAIRQNPEQWVWMHRRWRKRPHDSDMKGVLNIEHYAA